jgi:ribosomal-protein-alanine N-acetyltransferase
VSSLQVRRLAYADLPLVVAVERRAFPTPWSLAMFVLELSKPSGICLAAELVPAPGDEDPAGRSPLPELAGYLICSRYDEAWHLMNVAVSPDHRREGVASTLLQSLFARLDDGAHVTLEVRRSNTGAIALYEGLGFRAAGVRRRYYADNGEDALIMWRTPATLRGSLDDVPNADASLA